MSGALDPFRLLLIAVTGWMNQRQLQVIDYLREENRVLRQQLGRRHLRLNDDQRRRLAAKAKGLRRKLLAEVATHRKLIARKYDGRLARILERENHKYNQKGSQRLPPGSASAAPSDRSR